ncbi:hypothetical protein GV828_12850 [Flavobacterium sp. NST-5]|uniref:Knr4/Smi1-like domain-containing protein n=1 Tax=Flavobacterium ichthyis TaxID=2698827 RepID=A0ABW9ZFQ2_9FLAO|nr:SMI1/KNR4 family protein [Flavobacterium ichthyis]NBL66087.1 hypothetical protein [Flavobacterium ichthyis]
MKTTKINNSEIAIDSEDIQSFENEYDILIPNNLKQLYLKYNGGEMEFLDSRTYDFASIKHGELTIEGLLNDLKVHENIIPQNYVPFAITGVGHIITINIDDSKIYLFRYDELEPDLISNSLEEFLEIESIDDL